MGISPAVLSRRYTPDISRVCLCRVFPWCPHSSARSPRRRGQSEMMMAQPFPAPQVGMAHHPGMVQNHPMAPGQHPAAAHLAAQAPGGGMMQQVHAGVSAPGAPQASQPGPMAAGMQPVSGPGGPGPNAHTLSHLGPAHSHQMFQSPHLAQNCMFHPTPLFCCSCMSTTTVGTNELCF